jgi:chromate transporter
MSGADLVDVFLKFASLSMLAIGGALGTTPEMHRFLVEDRGWLAHTRFTDAIAIAQAAPGPNVLFVMLLGWQAGGAGGAAAAMLGIMLPSSLATYGAWRWKRSREDAPLVAAMRLGLSPIAIGLTAAAGWVIAAGGNGTDPRLWALSGATVAVMVRTRVNPMWLIGAGALAGALGLVG